MVKACGTVYEVRNVEKIDFIFMFQYKIIIMMLHIIEFKPSFSYELRRIVLFQVS